MLAGPAPLEVFGVPERPFNEDDSLPAIDGRINGFLGLGCFERMLATFGLRFLPSFSFTIFLRSFLMAGAAEAGVEPLLILGAGAGLWRGAGPAA